MYIFDGHLHLISQDESANDVAEALAILRANQTKHRMSNDVMECIQERIKNYPNNLSDGLHRQAVYVPVSAAALLRERPHLVAAAVRAFCHRDQIDMKACRAMKYFPPENRVQTSVVFTKYLYAMLTHSQYNPDRRTGWNLPVTTHSNYKAHSLGVKIACGFEILASQSKPVGNLDSNKNWLNYLDSLKKRGYFQDLLEGSIDYQRLLSSAEEYYRNHVDSLSYSSDIGNEILALLKTLDINSDEFKQLELPADDDEAWLNVSPEDLDEMLATRYGIKKTISANGNVDALELTGNITEFLDKKSEWDGIDLEQNKITNGDAVPPVPPKRGVKRTPNNNSKGVKFVDNDSSMKSESNNVDFDPDAFHMHVNEMLDMVIPDDNWESNSDMSDFEDENDLQKNIDEMGNAKSIKSYMDDMDKELSRTTIGKSFETKATADDSFEDIENFKPVNIDVNTLKNIAHSYQSQYGGPGPASNLLGSLGIHIKDDDEEKNTNLYNTQV